MKNAIVFAEVPPFDLTTDKHFINRYQCKLVLLQDVERQSRNTESFDDVVTADLMTREGLDNVVAALKKRYHVIASIGLSELSVIAAAYIAEKLGIEGIGVATAIKCRNKYRMMQSLEAGGVSVPAFDIVNPSCNLDNQVDLIGGYPVICKPLMGFASHGVIRVNNSIELKHAISHIKRNNKFLMSRFYAFDDTGDLKKVLMQAFKKGSEVAVDGFVYNGKTHILSIIDKPGEKNGPYFPDNIHITPSRLPKAELEALEITIHESVSAIGLDNSPFHAELKIENGVDYVIEIGARIGFPRCLQYSRGIDISSIAVAIKMNNLVNIQPRWHRYAGNYCINPEKPGFFEKALNMKKVINHPAVVEVPLFVKKGDRILPPPDSSSYIGFVIACSESYKETLDVLLWAKQELKIILQ